MSSEDDFPNLKYFVSQNKSIKYKEKFSFCENAAPQEEILI